MLLNSKNKKSALVVFAKTPGVTPAKTRLAKSIGTNSAELFYKNCLSCVESIFDSLHKNNFNYQDIWAIAEDESYFKNEQWKEKVLISQGTGGLGERLSLVYSKLIGLYETVYFIGTDMPHLDSKKLLDDMLVFESSKKDFLLGPVEDGGYYLFGGKKALSDKVWLDVEYSSKSTFNEFSNNLLKVGTLEVLSKSFDIDTIEDLRVLSSLDSDNLLTQQRKILQSTQEILRNC